MLLCPLLILFFCFSAKGQPTNLGDPQVINYYKKDIRSGTQTWDVAVDSLGYTYFGNNAGLLVFDGYNWELYPLPNQTIVRSVAVDNSGKIFVGGQGEFGYFTPDARGFLVYHSLLPMIESHGSAIEDVWEVLVTAQGVFFRTDNQVFRYFNEKVSSLFGRGRPLNFIGCWGNQIVVQDDTNRLYFFDGSGFQPRTQNPVFDKGRISGVLNYHKDSTLITTISDGIFVETKNGFEPWATSLDDFLRKNIIYCSALMPDGRLLIGTSFDGMVVIDAQRRVEQHLNKKNGLQNNTVLSIFGTSEGNIWLGLDNGLDLVDLSNPFRTYSPDGELEGAGSAVTLYKDHLYFGTNTGLYSIPWKKHYQLEEKKQAQLLPNTRGQVWSLNHIGDDLLMGHHNGAFQIDGAGIRKISNLMGIWKFVPLNEQEALAGFYKGLLLFEKQAGQWQQKYMIGGFSESSRLIFLDQAKNVWIGHPYRGVFFIPGTDIFKPEIKPVLFSQHNSQNKILKNVFYVLDQQIILNDGVQFYRHNPFSGTLEHYKDLDPWVIPDASLRFLVQDTYHNLWYGTNSGTYLMAPEKTFLPSFRKFPVNEITGLLPVGFESVFTIDKHNVIFPTEKGFLFFDPARYMEHSRNVEMFLTKAVLNANPDSLLFTGHLGNSGKGNSFIFRKKQNNFTFYFSVKGTSRKEFIQYSHFLKGSDQEWSEWVNSPVISYRKLPPGRYTLLVKAKYASSPESAPLSIELRILRPWYEYVFWIAAAMGAVAALFFFYKRQHKKYEREKSHLRETNIIREKEYQIYAKASEEEITRLQNEKLMAEINFKNQELTSFTYHLVNKNELISEINAVVHRLEHKLNDQQEVKKELKQILKLTERNADIDANWADFIKNFDQVHTNFYKRLTEEFNNLSPNDYKMCTYLRMNLTTKEIASLMNISPRSVETSRYRLRKKLGLPSDANLNQFLMNY